MSNSPADATLPTAVGKRRAPKRRQSFSLTEAVAQAKSSKIEEEMKKNLSASVAEASDPLICAICMSLFTDPYVTHCGHTFCASCLLQSIHASTACPLDVCRKSLVDDVKKSEAVDFAAESSKSTAVTKEITSAYRIYANHSLAALATQRRLEEEKALEQGTSQGVAHGATNDVLAMVEKLNKNQGISDKDASSILAAATNYSNRHGTRTQYIKAQLLKAFLASLRLKHGQRVNSLMRQMKQMERDEATVAAECRSLASSLNPSPVKSDIPGSPSPTLHATQTVPQYSNPTQTSNTAGSSSSLLPADQGGITSPCTPPPPAVATSISDVSLATTIDITDDPDIVRQIVRMGELWPFMVRAYENYRRGRTDCDRVGEGEETGYDDTTKTPSAQVLAKMASHIYGATKYTTCRSIAKINYAGEQKTAGQAIVSSIEFDRDEEYFVIAGVTKKIKMYNYRDVAKKASPQDIAYLQAPQTVMECANKISCLSWNTYSRSLLASSDYEGIVQLWDPIAQRALREYKEHSKRCWTVQFSTKEPQTFASGSDDGHVRLWSVNDTRSIQDIDVGVNICCVHFAPNDINYFVVGAADHYIHRYDRRRPQSPVNSFIAHNKAVSYVKYIDDEHIISASTDSTLRLWEVGDRCPRQLRTTQRVYTGHLNEKNFVGMSANEDIIVCGSETNALHIYHRGLNRSLLSYDFVTGNVIDNYATSKPSAMTASTTADFVSAVCCKKNSNIVIGANSRGTTEILELGLAGH